MVCEIFTQVSKCVTYKNLMMESLGPEFIFEHRLKAGIGLDLQPITGKHVLQHGSRFNKVDSQISRSEI